MKCWATNLLLVICPLAMLGCPQPYGDDDDDDNDSDDVTIEGTWTGGMDCSDPSGWMEMDVELPLTDQGDKEFSGHFEGTGEAVVGGDSYPLRLEADLELELTDDSGGTQSLEARWSNCEMWVDSEYNDDPCEFTGAWTWDGADTIDFEDPPSGCEMTLTR